MLKRLWSEESGLSTIEFALVLTLVSIGSITMWQEFGAPLVNTAH